MTEAKATSESSGLRSARVHAVVAQLNDSRSYQHIVWRVGVPLNTWTFYATVPGYWARLRYLPSRSTCRLVVRQVLPVVRELTYSDTQGAMLHTAVEADLFASARLAEHVLMELSR